MAELKWNNIDGSNTNTAVSTLINANNVMYDRVKDLNSVALAHLGNMQKGQEDQFAWDTQRNTDLILNQMANTSSQEELLKLQQEGITDGSQLQTRFGNRVDMDKVNQARSTWANDTLARNEAKDNLKDFTDTAVNLKAQINTLVQQGKTSEAIALLEQSKNAFSSKTYNSLNNVIRTGFTDDRKFLLDTRLNDATIKAQNAQAQLLQAQSAHFDAETQAKNTATIEAKSSLNTDMAKRQIEAEQNYVKAKQDNQLKREELEAQLSMPKFSNLAIQVDAPLSRNDIETLEKMYNDAVSANDFSYLLSFARSRSPALAGQLANIFDKRAENERKLAQLVKADELTDSQYRLISNALNKDVSIDTFKGTNTGSTSFNLKNGKSNKVSNSTNEKGYPNGDNLSGSNDESRNAQQTLSTNSTSDVGMSVNGVSLNGRFTQNSSTSKTDNLNVQTSGKDKNTDTSSTKEDKLKNEAQAKQQQLNAETNNIKVPPVVASPVSVTTPSSGISASLVNLPNVIDENDLEKVQDSFSTTKKPTTEEIAQFKANLDRKEKEKENRYQLEIQTANAQNYNITDPNEREAKIALEIAKIGYEYGKTSKSALEEAQKNYESISKEVDVRTPVNIHNSEKVAKVFGEAQDKGRGVFTSYTANGENNKIFNNDIKRITEIESKNRQNTLNGKASMPSYIESLKEEQAKSTDPDEKAYLKERIDALNGFEKAFKVALNRNPNLTRETFLKTFTEAYNKAGNNVLDNQAVNGINTRDRKSLDEVLSFAKNQSEPEDKRTSLQALEIDGSITDKVSATEAINSYATNLQEVLNKNFSFYEFIDSLGSNIPKRIKNFNKYGDNSLKKEFLVQQLNKFTPEMLKLRDAPEDKREAMMSTIKDKLESILTLSESITEASLKDVTSKVKDQVERRKDIEYPIAQVMGMFAKGGSEKEILSAIREDAGYNATNTSSLFGMAKFTPKIETTLNNHMSKVQKVTSKYSKITDDLKVPQLLKMRGANYQAKVERYAEQLERTEPYKTSDLNSAIKDTEAMVRIAENYGSKEEVKQFQKQLSNLQDILSKINNLNSEIEKANLPN